MTLERTAVIDRLTEFVRTDLIERPDYPLRPDEPLITSGLLDSFSLARVAVFVEEELSVYLPDSELTVENIDSVEMLTEQVLKWSKQA